ncbi:hypothetical protein NL676_020705 [Syzygium grande]|nr:hypothetical protein NL676_020705 [Syzygium grande]
MLAMRFGKFFFLSENGHQGDEGAEAGELLRPGIAVDASMSIYQFLVVVGRKGTQMLTNEAGQVTSHLQGMHCRTIRLLEAGIQPVYVFDGKPPDLKKQELAQR